MFSPLRQILATVCCLLENEIDLSTSHLKLEAGLTEMAVYSYFPDKWYGSWVLKHKKLSKKTKNKKQKKQSQSECIYPSLSSHGYDGFVKINIFFFKSLF